MKKTFLALFAFASVAVFSQTGNVGINTPTPNTTLAIQGGLEVGYREVTASTTLTKTDYNIAFTGTAASTITLPTIIAATGAQEFVGRIYRVKNLSSVDVTLAAATGQTIRTESAAGVSSITVPAGYTLEVVNSGAATWNADFLRGRQSKSWLVTYELNNTLGDWVNNFDTKIDATRYSISIVGFKLVNSNGTFGLMEVSDAALTAAGNIRLKNNNTVGTATTVGNATATTVSGGRFSAFSIYPFVNAAKTWAISADYPDAALVNNDGSIAKGKYTITVLVTTMENYGNAQTITVDMNNSQNGAAAAAPDLK